MCWLQEYVSTEGRFYLIASRIVRSYLALPAITPIVLLVFWVVNGLRAICFRSFKILFFPCSLPPLFLLINSAIILSTLEDTSKYPKQCFILLPNSHNLLVVIIEHLQRQLYVW